ncbi:hypothetical protein KOR42_22770 [Thalassoglobus neptunius]|uniref:Uncharacterized protein n=1 Tax=Thalassoglobus neptunius TaxID=1938619 RepID=A0A5C5X7H0_9PLAN|nr:hypothetical protein [Thalassoglobus neptunius]TWT58890.1 hypothetical protein KOR42_22770 [Thalassoglobus neptunius]
MAAPQWVLDLRVRRDEITTELRAIDNNASRSNPGSGPDASGEGAIAFHQYKMGLYEELDRIDERLRKAEETIQAEQNLDGTIGPFEIETQVFS